MDKPYPWNRWLTPLAQKRASQTLPWCWERSTLSHTSPRNTHKMAPRLSSPAAAIYSHREVALTNVLTMVVNISSTYFPPDWSLKQVPPESWAVPAECTITFTSISHIHYYGVYCIWSTSSYSFRWKYCIEFILTQSRLYSQQGERQGVHACMQVHINACDTRIITHRCMYAPAPRKAPARLGRTTTRASSPGSCLKICANTTVDTSIVLLHSKPTIWIFLLFTSKSLTPARLATKVQQRLVDTNSMSAALKLKPGRFSSDFVRAPKSSPSRAGTRLRWQRRPESECTRCRENNTYVYIYIYVERERDVSLSLYIYVHIFMVICMYIYIYIYIYNHTI